MIRYQLALLGHSQRWLPPSLAYLILLAVLYNDPTAPVPPEFAVSAGGLTVVACWLTVALVDAEDPVQRLITLVHARRLSTVLAGFVATAALCCVVLTAVSLAWAALVHHGLPVAVLADGVVAHAACAATGIALGLPCSRLLLPRIGYTVLAALALLGVVLLVRWVPVVNPMLRSLTGAGSHTGAVALGLLGGGLLLVVSAAVTGRIVHRRA